MYKFKAKIFQRLLEEKRVKMHGKIRKMYENWMLRVRFRNDPRSPGSEQIPRYMAYCRYGLMFHQILLDDVKLPKVKLTPEEVFHAFLKKNAV